MSGRHNYSDIAKGYAGKNQSSAQNDRDGNFDKYYHGWGADKDKQLPASRESTFVQPMEAFLKTSTSVDDVSEIKDQPTKKEKRLSGAQRRKLAKLRRKNGANDVAQHAAMDQEALKPDSSEEGQSVHIPVEQINTNISTSQKTSKSEEEIKMVENVGENIDQVTGKKKKRLSGAQRRKLAKFNRDNKRTTEVSQDTAMEQEAPIPDSTEECQRILIPEEQEAPIPDSTEEGQRILIPEEQEPPIPDSSEKCQRIDIPEEQVDPILDSSDECQRIHIPEEQEAPIPDSSEECQRIYIPEEQIYANISTFHTTSTSEEAIKIVDDIGECVDPLTEKKKRLSGAQRRKLAKLNRKNKANKVAQDTKIEQFAPIPDTSELGKRVHITEEQIYINISNHGPQTSQKRKAYGVQHTDTTAKRPRFDENYRQKKYASNSTPQSGFSHRNNFKTQMKSDDRLNMEPVTPTSAEVPKKTSAIPSPYAHLPPSPPRLAKPVANNMRSLLPPPDFKSHTGNLPQSSHNTPVVDGNNSESGKDWKSGNSTSNIYTSNTGSFTRTMKTIDSGYKNEMTQIGINKGLVNDTQRCGNNDNNKASNNRFDINTGTYQQTMKTRDTGYKYEIAQIGDNKGPMNDTQRSANNDNNKTYNNRFGINTGNIQEYARSNVTISKTNVNGPGNRATIENTHENHLKSNKNTGNFQLFPISLNSQPPVNVGTGVMAQYADNKYPVNNMAHELANYGNHPNTNINRRRPSRFNDAACGNADSLDNRTLFGGGKGPLDNASRFGSYVHPNGGNTNPNRFEGSGGPLSGMNAHTGSTKQFGDNNGETATNSGAQSRFGNSAMGGVKSYGISNDRFNKNTGNFSQIPIKASTGFPSPSGNITHYRDNRCSTESYTPKFASTENPNRNTGNFQQVPTNNSRGAGSQYEHLSKDTFTQQFGNNNGPDNNRFNRSAGNYPPHAGHIASVANATSFEGNKCVADNKPPFENSGNAGGSKTNATRKSRFDMNPADVEHLTKSNYGENSSRYGNSGIAEKSSHLGDRYSRFGNSGIADKSAHFGDNNSGLGNSGIVEKSPHVGDNNSGLGNSGIVEKSPHVGDNNSRFGNSGSVEKSAHVVDNNSRYGNSGSVEKSPHVVDNNSRFGNIGIVEKSPRVGDNRVPGPPSFGNNENYGSKNKGASTTNNNSFNINAENDQFVNNQTVGNVPQTGNNLLLPTGNTSRFPDNKVTENSDDAHQYNNPPPYGNEKNLQFGMKRRTGMQANFGFNNKMDQHFGNYNRAQPPRPFNQFRGNNNNSANNAHFGQYSNSQQLANDTGFQINPPLINGMGGGNQRFYEDINPAPPVEDNNYKNFENRPNNFQQFKQNTGPNSNNKTRFGFNDNGPGNMRRFRNNPGGPRGQMRQFGNNNGRQFGNNNGGGPGRYQQFDTDSNRQFGGRNQQMSRGRGKSNQQRNFNALSRAQAGFKNPPARFPGGNQNGSKPQRFNKNTNGNNCSVADGGNSNKTKRPFLKKPFGAQKQNRFGKAQNKFGKLLKKKVDKGPKNPNKEKKTAKKPKKTPKKKDGDSKSEDEHIDVNKQIFGDFQPIAVGQKKPAKGHLKPEPQEYWKQWWSLYGYVEKSLTQVDPNDDTVKSVIHFQLTPSDAEFRKRKRVLLVMGVAKILRHIRLNENDYALRDIFNVLKYKHQLEDGQFQQHLTAKELERVQMVLKHARKKTRRALFYQSLICRWHFSTLIIKRFENGESLKCGHARKLISNKAFNYMVWESIQELKKLTLEDWPEFEEFYKTL